MRLLICLAAALGIAGTAGAAKRASRLPEGTAVVIVGQVSSPPRGSLNEQKMQVAIGPRRVDYTLHLSRSDVRKGRRGRKVDEDRFDHGDWVRAEGRIMSDPRRIMVSRLRVVTRGTASLAGSPYSRPGFNRGYLMWPAGEARVAGSRQVYRRDH